MYMENNLLTWVALTAEEREDIYIRISDVDQLIQLLLRMRHSERWDSLKRYFVRNKHSCMIFTVLLFTVTLDYVSVRPLFPRWLRMRRVVENVDEYSKMLPLSHIEKDVYFEKFVSKLKMMTEPPYVIFFDKSNIDVTLNYVCNLAYFPGAVERLVAVSFDPAAEKELNRQYPHIPTVTVDFSRVRSKLSSLTENRKYVTYQLVLMLRSLVSAALAGRGIDFWAMQQDSIWTKNFAEMNVEAEYPESPLLFDTVGNEQFHVYDRMKGWICGSTFFVRGNHLTREFFRKVALLMTRRMSPDSSIMTYLCGATHYGCTKLPKRVISSSNYFMGNRNFTPAMIQIDHESKVSKMELFRQNKFVFRNKNGSCNDRAVSVIRESVRKALPEVQEMDTVDMTTMFETIYYNVKEYIGLDPYNNKRFLRTLELLV